MYIRTHKNKNYTVLDNTALKDENLSWQAKGLLSYLLSLPDDWQIYISELQTHAKNGKASTANTINELIDAGYITRSRLKNKSTGKFEGYEYHVYESGCLPYPNNRDTDNPYTDNPYTENRQLLNTNILNTNIQNTEEEKQKTNTPSSHRNASDKDYKANKDNLSDNAIKSNKDLKTPPERGTPEYAAAKRREGMIELELNAIAAYNRIYEQVYCKPLPERHKEVVARTLTKYKPPRDLLESAIRAKTNPDWACEMIAQQMADAAKKNTGKSRLR